MPSPRLPVFRPVIPSTPSRLFVLVSVPGTASVIDGVAAICARVGFADARSAIRSRSAVVLTLRGLMPVGSTSVVPESPSRAVQSRTAARNAPCEPNAHVDTASA